MKTCVLERICVRKFIAALFIIVKKKGKETTQNPPTGTQRNVDI